MARNVAGDAGLGRLRGEPARRRGASSRGRCAGTPARRTRGRRRRDRSRCRPPAETSGCWRRTHCAKPRRPDRRGPRRCAREQVRSHSSRFTRVPRNQPLSRRCVDRGVLELVRRVGHPPARARRSRSGTRRCPPAPAGCGPRAWWCRAGRSSPARNGVRISPIRCRLPSCRKPPKTSRPRTEPSASSDVDLERGTAVAADPVAHVGQRALQRERLAHHVDRVGVVADVAEVGVAVVTDQLAAADRAEQRAVGRERVDAGLAQRVEHLLDRVQQRRHVLGAAGVEGLRRARCLVDAERAALAR